MPDVRPSLVAPFLVGAAVAAAVAWWAWPTAAVVAHLPELPSHMRSIGKLQPSPTESLEAVAIQNPDRFSATICAIYRSDTHTLMECPVRDAIDLDGELAN